MHLFSREMESVWAFSAAFKSVESHKAESHEWPLGILCELPALIRRQLPTTEVQVGQRAGGLEERSKGLRFMGLLEKGQVNAFVHNALF